MWNGVPGSGRPEAGKDRGNRPEVFILQRQDKDVAREFFVVVQAIAAATLAAGSVVLLAAVAAASTVPARRANRIDPVEALRETCPPSPYPLAVSPRSIPLASPSSPYPPRFTLSLHPPRRSHLAVSISPHPPRFIRALTPSFAPVPKRCRRA